jgi:hypothetical protein
MYLRMSGDIGDQKSTLRYRRCGDLPTSGFAVHFRLDAKRSQTVAKFFCASKRKKGFLSLRLHLSETLKCEAKRKRNEPKQEKRKERESEIEKQKKIKFCVAFESVSPKATPVLERACPTAECAASGRFCPTAACAAFPPLDMSVLQQPVLPLNVF